MAKRAAPPPLFAPPKEWLLAAQEVRWSSHALGPLTHAMCRAMPRSSGRCLRPTYRHLARAVRSPGAQEWKVTDRDDDKRTALHWAAAKGKEAAVKFILAQGADPNTADEEGELFVHVPAEDSKAPD